MTLKIRVPSDKEDLNLKIFNMIPRVNEAKVLLKHIHVIVNSNSIVQNIIKIKNENDKWSKAVIAVKRVLE